MIIKTLKTLALFTLISSAASAEQVTGRVIGLEPIYITQTIQTPHQVCNTVQVSSNNDNALRGAIIGGIIGNSLRGGSKIRNRNAGILIGGILGSNSGGNVVRQENRCHTQYSQSVQQVIHQYWVVIDVHGQIIRKALWARNGSTDVRVGQRISLNVNYSLN